MLIIPAIDLKDGKCVRLRQGRAEDVTVYGDDPVEMARRWAGEGAEYLHVVDLDGAFEGRPIHLRVIDRIAAAIDVPFEVGGGLRDSGHIRSVLDAGAGRAIIGTRAFAEPEALRGLADDFGSRVAVGIDARDGWVQVKGWVETTAMKAVDLAAAAAVAGIRTLIYTDTSRDGMLQGVNAAAMGDMCAAVSCDVIASGGVSSPDDVGRLAALKKANLVGAIVGKALYDGRVTLAGLRAGL